jgi:hypothetical protein
MKEEAIMGIAELAQFLHVILITAAGAAALLIRIGSAHPEVNTARCRNARTKKRGY